MLSGSPGLHAFPYSLCVSVYYLSDLAARRSVCLTRLHSTVQYLLIVVFVRCSINCVFFLSSCILGRPTYMSADLYFTRLSFFCFLSFFLFSRQLILQLAERKSTISVHMVGSKCMLKTQSEIWGISSPTNRGSKNHLFGRLRNSTANFMAYIFGMRHGIQVRSKLQGVSYIL